MYEFPLPLQRDTELERERLKYAVHSQRALYEQLDTQFPNNQDQQNVFDTIMDAVVNPSNTKRFFFIHGPGGTGQTTIVKNLIAAIRSLGTTLAATNYDDACSAHSTFKFPVVQEEDKDDEVRTECNLHNTQQYILLQHTAIVFWDEFISNDRELFEAVLRALTGLRLIFVCIGDFRQILPVITNGNTMDTINACISSSPTWRLFTRLRLQINIRLQLYNSNPSQAETLLAIGEGRNCDDAIIMSEDTNSYSMQIGSSYRYSTYLILLHIFVTNQFKRERVEGLVLDAGVLMHSCGGCPVGRVWVLTTYYNIYCGRGYRWE